MTSPGSQKPDETKPLTPLEQIDPDSDLAQVMVRMRELGKANPHWSPHEYVDKLFRVLWETSASKNTTQGDASRDFMASMLFESDRGCVLVAASILDNELEELFRSLFRARSDATEKEMDFLLTQRPMPPLQSTSIKIRLAFALGLIDRHLMDALSELQSLRSKVAAHSRTLMDLTIDDTVKISKHFSEESKALIRNELQSDTFIELRRGIGRPVSTEKVVFTIVVLLLRVQVQCVRESIVAQKDGSSQ